MTQLHFHVTVDSDKTHEAVATFLALLLEDHFPTARVELMPLATTLVALRDTARPLDRITFDFTKGPQ